VKADRTVARRVPAPADLGLLLLPSVLLVLPILLLLLSPSVLLLVPTLVLLLPMRTLLLLPPLLLLLFIFVLLLGVDRASVAQEQKQNPLYL
jgi:hypothetical protein